MAKDKRCLLADWNSLTRGSDMIMRGRLLVLVPAIPREWCIRSAGKYTEYLLSVSELER